TKRFQPDYRRYLRTVSRCVRLPTHGFPSVVAFGGATILDRASRRTRHSAEGRESTFAACSRPRTREFGARAGGDAVGFGAFAIALLKRVMQRRACLPLAGAVFVVLLCAVGLEGEAQAQFSPPTVTNVNPNTGPIGGHQCNHHWHQFFRRDSGPVR